MTTGAAPTYGSYLHVDDLLALQRERTSPPHHDELLFIVIHQVYELWFKQMLHEIEAAMRNLAADDALYMLLEDFIEFDERMLLWRGRHVRMVERMIGMKAGTGGSLGVRYLQTTL